MPPADTASSSFPKRLYRWHRMGGGRPSSPSLRHQPEGTTSAPDGGGVLEYMTVASAAEEAAAASEGWAALAVTMVRRAMASS
jgi:hypothetical protein